MEDGGILADWQKSRSVLLGFANPRQPPRARHSWHICATPARRCVAGTHGVLMGPGGRGWQRPGAERAPNPQKAPLPVCAPLLLGHFLFTIKKPQMTACQETFGAHMSVVNGHNKRLYYIYSRASYWVSRGMPEGLMYLRNVWNDFGENTDKWKKWLKILELTKWWVPGFNPSRQIIYCTSDLSCLGIEAEWFLNPFSVAVVVVPMR